MTARFTRLTSPLRGVDDGAVRHDSVMPSFVISSLKLSGGEVISSSR